MEILTLIIVFAFVFGVLGVVAYALFELTPFAPHKDRFRDPVTHDRLFDSPRLD